MSSVTYNFTEAAHKLGYKSTAGLSSFLINAGCHVKKDCLLPTDGKGNRLLTAYQVEELKRYKRGRGGAPTKMTKSNISAIRRILKNPQPVVEEVEENHPMPLEELNGASVTFVNVSEQAKEKAKTLNATQRAILALAAAGNSDLAAELMLEAM